MGGSRRARYFMDCVNTLIRVRVTLMFGFDSCDGDDLQRRRCGDVSKDRVPWRASTLNEVAFSGHARTINHVTCIHLIQHGKQ